VDAEDQSMIAAEVEKYPHPLEDSKIHLYNPITGQVAPADVNVMGSFFIGEKMEHAYIATLPVIDLESMFLRLVMIGQQ